MPSFPLPPPPAVFSVSAFGQGNTYFLIHKCSYSHAWCNSISFYHSYRSHSYYLRDSVSKRKQKKIMLCLHIYTNPNYCANIKSQHLQNISTCTFCGKGGFSNLLSQAPLKQPHKATASKFLLLNSNLHTTKLHSSQRVGGAFLFNLNLSIQLSRNSMHIWVQETGKKNHKKKIQ